MSVPWCSRTGSVVVTRSPTSARSASASEGGSARSRPERSRSCAKWVVASILEDPRPGWRVFYGRGALERTLLRVGLPREGHERRVGRGDERRGEPQPLQFLLRALELQAQRLARALEV